MQKGCLTALIEWAVMGGLFLFVMIVTDKNMSSQELVIYISVAATSGLLIAGFLTICQWIFAMIGIKWENVKAGVTTYTVTYDGGLQAPRGTRANVTLSPETMIINCCGNEFVLENTKIRNVDFQTSEREKQYVDHVFSTRGRLVVGEDGKMKNHWAYMPKVRTKRLRVGYVTITYESSSGRYVTFRLSDVYANQPVCMKLANKLKPKVNQKVNRVQL